MINFPRQAYVNPFLSALNTPFGGVNPLALGQQMGGIVPAPFGYLPMTQFGQYNPLAAQIGAGFNPVTSQIGQAGQFTSPFGGVTPAINPVFAQTATNWPGSQYPQQGVGGRIGPYGVDPRVSAGAGQQFGYTDPNVILGL